MIKKKLTLKDIYKEEYYITYFEDRYGDIFGEGKTLQEICDLDIPSCFVIDLVSHSNTISVPGEFWKEYVEILGESERDFYFLRLGQDYYDYKNGKLSNKKKKSVRKKLDNCIKEEEFGRKKLLKELIIKYDL